MYLFENKYEFVPVGAGPNPATLYLLYAFTLLSLLIFLVEYNPWGFFKINK